MEEKEELLSCIAKGSLRKFQTLWQKNNLTVAMLTSLQISWTNLMSGKVEMVFRLTRISAILRWLCFIKTKISILWLTHLIRNFKSIKKCQLSQKITKSAQSISDLVIFNNLIHLRDSTCPQWRSSDSERISLKWTFNLKSFSSSWHSALLMIRCQSSAEILTALNIFQTICSKKRTSK